MNMFIIIGLIVVTLFLLGFLAAMYYVDWQENQQVRKKKRQKDMTYLLEELEKHDDTALFIQGDFYQCKDVKGIFILFLMSLDCARKDTLSKDRLKTFLKKNNSQIEAVSRVMQKIGQLNTPVPGITIVN